LKNLKKRIDREINLIGQAYFQVNEIAKKDFLLKGVEKCIVKKAITLDKVDDIGIIRDYIHLTKTILK